MTEQVAKANLKKKTVGNKTRNDIIFIAVLLSILTVIGACVYLFRKEGDVVSVTLDGKPYAEYPLSKDIKVEIKTGNDEDRINVLVIKNGEAYVESASCPDKICTDHRPISRDGESIVCLPHRIAVTVRKTSKNADIVA